MTIGMDLDVTVLQKCTIKVNIFTVHLELRVAKKLDQVVKNHAAIHPTLSAATQKKSRNEVFNE